jgi:hypothetical protein
VVCNKYYRLVCDSIRLIELGNLDASKDHPIHIAILDGVAVNPCPPPFSPARLYFNIYTVIDRNTIVYALNINNYGCLRY